MPKSKFKTNTTVDKIHVDLDLNAVEILNNVVAHIASNNISSRSYSDAVRWLYKETEKNTVEINALLKAIGPERTVQSS